MPLTISDVFHKKYRQSKDKFKNSEYHVVIFEVKLVRYLILRKMHFTILSFLYSKDSLSNSLLIEA